MQYSSPYNYTNHATRHTHVFIDNLNSIFLINNHIQHPTWQQHHPNKLLIASIVHKIYWTPHTIHIHKVHAHSCITRNEIVDTLANEGILKENQPQWQTHMASPIINMQKPLLLKGLKIARHNKAIHLITRALQANIKTWFFTLTNAGNLNNKPPKQTILYWLLKCTCPQITC